MTRNLSAAWFALRCLVYSLTHRHNPQENR